jgi:hypothetical protein
MVGFNFAPRGWAFTDGQILPINQNQSLYSLLGTTYGGDGRTSFALPDLRSRGNRSGLVLLRYVFGDVYKLTEQGWLILTWRWGVFFLALAVLNEIVWRNFSTDFWVAFKVWGIAPITLVFSLAQLGVLSRHAIENDKPEAQTDSSV